MKNNDFIQVEDEDSRLEELYHGRHRPSAHLVVLVVFVLMVSSIHSLCHTIHITENFVTVHDRPRVVRGHSIRSQTAQQQHQMQQLLQQQLMQKAKLEQSVQHILNAQHVVPAILTAAQDDVRKWAEEWEKAEEVGIIFCRRETMEGGSLHLLHVLNSYHARGDLGRRPVLITRDASKYGSWIVSS